jgi:hypothetical protein
MATLGLYRDGTVRIGTWGREITPTAELIAYRQNCPPLLDAGQINPDVAKDDPNKWGRTVGNAVNTWRSGLGISADGRFLIYAVGNSLTVRSLALALQAAGADYAMQLDINAFWTRFVTFQPAQDAKATSSVVAHKLINQMSGGPTQFLAPDVRDFFYVTFGPTIDVTKIQAWILPSPIIVPVDVVSLLRLYPNLPWSYLH